MDVVLVCPKRGAHHRRKSEGETAFQQTLEHAGAKAQRLMPTSDLGLRTSGFRRLAFSVNDRRGIVRSQSLLAAMPTSAFTYGRRPVA